MTVVSNKFLSDHKAAVDTFIEEHKESAAAALSDVDTTAKLVVEQGIIAKEPLAKKAIPYCNVVCITGKDMKNSLEGYLQVMFDIFAQLAHIRFAQVLDPGIGIHFSNIENLLAHRRPDAEDVGQANFDALFSGQVNTRNTCHVLVTPPNDSVVGMRPLSLGIRA